MTDAADQSTAWYPRPEAVHDHDAPTPRQGLELDDRFRLGEFFGRGASGEVWSALDTRIGRTVALKIVHPDLRDDTSRERLRREARAATAGHPNLVSIHDLHESDGHLYLSMELVEGRSLKARIQKEATLPVNQVISIGSDVASALDHLHGHGFVHRDVKPGNLLLTPDGYAKLCDLGLSRPLAPGGTVTATQMVVGTPAYMAPEQGRTGDLSPAADIYSLGLTLYKALTGEVPLEGESAVDTLITRQRERARPARALRPDCPPWLSRLITSMLDPEPAHRPTAREVLCALQKRRFAWRPTRRQALLACLVVAATLVIAASIVFWTQLAARTIDPATDETVNELMVNAEGYDSGTVFRVADGRGRPVSSLVSAAPFDPERAEFFRTRSVGIADLDGDGRRDVVFANPDRTVAEQLEIHRRLPDGSIRLEEQWNLRRTWQYEDDVFDEFLPRDVECRDLDGDGRPEIIVAYNSTPYYLGEVLVLRSDGTEVLRVRHPGLLTNVRAGDRNRNGRCELYVGATNNFHEQNHGNESSPAVFAVEADWDRSGQALELFGPGRSMAPAVPPGFDVTYIAMPHQRALPPVTPWRFAIVHQLSTAGDDHLLLVHSDRVTWLGTDRLSFLRAFRFDPQLRQTDGLWIVGPLEQRGIDAETLNPAELTVTYWNGSTWQPEVCAIPQAG
jgi:hypothetical protein